MLKKNLNNKKIEKDEDYLINKYNKNIEFSDNTEKEFSKIKISKKHKDSSENINNMENSNEEIGSLNNDILNDSLENEDEYNMNEIKDQTMNSNIDIDELYTSIISNKRKSIAERNNSIKRKLTIGSSNANTHKISNLNSMASTEQKTNTKNHKFPKF